MAPRFNLHIDLGNAAMRTQRDVGRSLVELGQSMIEMGDGTPGFGQIRDSNGNLVGSYVMPTIANDEDE